jgi:hypothetical protein
MGSEVYVYFSVYGGAEEHIAALEPDPRLRVDADISLIVDTSRMHFFDKESGQRIG